MNKTVKQSMMKLSLTLFTLSLCALAPPARAAGEVVAWGDNSQGQTNVPVGLSGVVAVAACNYHSLALKGDGTVVAWGDNSQGQTNVPAGLSGVVAVAAGYLHSLALKGDGTVLAWGDNRFGQSSVPAGLSSVVAVAAGAWHSLALKGDGTVVAWGENSFGQSSVPAGLSGVVAIAAGYEHSLALKGDGTVVAWGDNSDGEISVPAGLSGIVAIAADGWHSLVLKGDRTVVAWGANGAGQTNVPAGLSGVVAVAVGQGHSLALKGDGTVVAWGDNSQGQTNVPAGLSGVAAIAAGGGHSLAVKKVPGLSPAYGSVFFSPWATLAWDAVPGASQYAVWMGSRPGTWNYYARAMSGRSCIVGLPADGRNIWATLWAFVGGAWQQVKAHPYRAITPQRAEMLRPANGAILNSAVAEFIWDNGVGVSTKALWVGSNPASYDLFAGVVTGQSRTLVLPADGRTLYVRLWSWINRAWQFNDYTYQAFGP